MSIKYIQEQLGVTADGLWGNISHTALIEALRCKKTIKASNNFTVNELLHSDTAVAKGVENFPSIQDFKNLMNAVEHLWQPVRELLGHPVSVTSAYRNPTVNKLVGSSGSSAHLVGYAMDFRCPMFGNTSDVVKFLTKELPKRGIKFDQLILEYRNSPNSWVHLAWKNQRGQQRSQVFNIG